MCIYINSIHAFYSIPTPVHSTLCRINWERSWVFMCVCMYACLLFVYCFEFQVLAYKYYMSAHARARGSSTHTHIYIHSTHTKRTPHDRCRVLYTSQTCARAQKWLPIIFARKSTSFSASPPTQTAPACAHLPFFWHARTRPTKKPIIYIGVCVCVRVRWSVHGCGLRVCI